MNKSLEFSKELKHKKKLCQTYYWIGRMSLSRSEFKLAKDVSEKCYALAQKLKDPNMIGLASYLSGSYHLLKGSLKESLSLFKKAAELIEDTDLAQVARSQVGFCYIWHKCDKEKSLKILADLVKQSKKAENPSEVFFWQCQMHTYILSSDWKNLIQYIDQGSYKISPPLSYMRDVFYACGQVRAGDKKKGFQQLNSLIKQFNSDVHARETMGHLYTYLLPYLADGYLYQGDHVKAKKIALETIKAEHGYQRMGFVLAHLVVAEASLAEKKVDLKSVKKSLDDAKAIIDESKMDIYLLKYYYVLYLYHLHMSKGTEAQQALKKLIKFCDKHKFSVIKKKALRTEKEILKKLSTKGLLRASLTLNL